MIGPRWRKVLRDLWSSKTRTLLVVLSTAVGVAAIGMVVGTYQTITRDLPAGFERVNPAHATLLTTAFTDDLVQVVGSVPGVNQVQGRFTLTLRVQVAPETWRDLRVFFFSDFDAVQINRFFPKQGAWPPGEREILIERASLGLTGAQMGDDLLVETPLGRQRTLHIAGLVQDINFPSGAFSGQTIGYANFATLEWLGYAKAYNELLLTVQGSAPTRPEIRSVAQLVEEKVERSGRPVYSTTIPEPGKHWFQPYLTPMATILSVLGLVILLMSSFLVVNTISALVSQQARQIGVMKAIGARSGQIVGMYFVYMLVIGLVALAIAVPLANLGTNTAVNIIARLINFTVLEVRLGPDVLRLQAVLALLVPLVAAFFPIRTAARMTVRETMSDYGLGKANFGAGSLDRLVSAVRLLSRPLLLSLRNTFRKKGRLTLTLITLTLGSAIFIGVLNVRASLVATLDQVLDYYGFDVVVFFNRAYRVEQIHSEIKRVSGVAQAETWGLTNARSILPDGSESESIVLVAPPTSTELIRPQIIAGRWLVDADSGGLVVNTDVVRENPRIQVGSLVPLKIEGEEYTFEVVGISRSVMSGPWAYTTYPYFARTLGGYGLASAVYVQGEQHGPAAQSELAKRLEDHFESVGLRVASTGKAAELRATTLNQYNIIFIFLLMMSFLLTIVGGLGLTGTMSLNVLERTREIGVMRAIGASSWTIIRIVVFEGMLIGLMSWVFGVLLAVPLSRLLGNSVGVGLLQFPLTPVYSSGGALLWLGIIVVLAGLSSYLPARSASRLAVREVLAYE